MPVSDFELGRKLHEMSDNVNPDHYRQHPSGVEAIVITEHFSFCLGNAIKYIWRAGLKKESSRIEDLRKAAWYIDREIARLVIIGGSNDDLD
jgi:hypothetical protein